MLYLGFPIQGSIDWRQALRHRSGKMTSRVATFQDGSVVLFRTIMDQAMGRYIWPCISGGVTCNLCFVLRDGAAL